MEGIKYIAGQALPAKRKFARREVYEWRDMRCVSIYGYNVYTRELYVQLALAFRSFLSAFVSQQRQPGIHTSPRDISVRGRERLSCALVLFFFIPLFAFTYVCIARPKGSEALIYLKDEVDVGASPSGPRVARFSDASLIFVWIFSRTRIFFPPFALFLSQSIIRCQYLFFELLLARSLPFAASKFTAH